MSDARFVVGDTRTETAKLADGSVDLIVTSPPFLALRSYLPADHPDKDSEIGSEPTPAAFLHTLLGLTSEWRRVLAPHGSLVVELGDTYSGSGGAGGDYNPDGLREGQPKFRQHNMAQGYSGGRHGMKTKEPGVMPLTGGPGWPEAKSLCLIPELYRVALAYGVHSLEGSESPAGRWKVRNVIRWVRPNPPVGSLGDKWRPATSTLVVACVSKDRWFDLDAVRGPYSSKTNARVAKGVESQQRTGKSAERDGNWASLDEADNNGAGAPPNDYTDAVTAVLADALASDDNSARDLSRALRDAGLLDWGDALELSTHPYKGAHYATWPPALVKPIIESMCPREVCRVCGTPRTRITENTSEYQCAVDEMMATVKAETSGSNRSNPGKLKRGQAGVKSGVRSVPYGKETLGWSDCGHGDYRRGLVFDPFAGSGTTLAVASGLGRDSLGVDLDERNADLARERCGLFLSVGS